MAYRWAIRGSPGRYNRAQMGRARRADLIALPSPIRGLRAAISVSSALIIRSSSSRRAASLGSGHSRGNRQPWRRTASTKISIVLQSAATRPGSVSAPVIRRKRFGHHLMTSQLEPERLGKLRDLVAGDWCPMPKCSIWGRIAGQCWRF
jgi:hypothetical protein